LDELTIAIKAILYYTLTMKGVYKMTFSELINIRIYTCDARNRLEDLRKAGIITSRDYNDSCDRFHETHVIVEQYMDAHQI